MKPGGGLVYVTGPMGSGKSYRAVKEIAKAAMSGRYVVTNIALKDNWAEVVARHTPQSWFTGSFSKRAKFYRSLYIYEEEIYEAMRYNPPVGKKEGRALFIWDESHNEIGNRSWMEDNRELLNKWATQFRKLGYIGYAISQHKDNTDTAWRRIANFEVRLRNQREIVRVLGMRVCPVPFFLALWVPANTPRLKSDSSKGGGSVLHMERYFLGWEKRLYNTLGIFANLEVELDELGMRIQLPKAGLWDGVKPARTERPDNLIVIKRHTKPADSITLPTVISESLIRDDGESLASESGEEYVG